jgi:hypothetical protein
MEGMSERDAVRIALLHVPGDPADETVDGIRVLGLGQRKLMPTPPELVASVLQPIGPRNEHLAPTCGRHLVDGVAIDDVPAVDGVRTETSAYLDDHDALAAEFDLELLAGGAGHR